MSKLFKLKEWVTVPEAARHLAIVCNEDVSEADVLRLALDGHLKISVNIINGTDAKEYRIVSDEEREEIETILKPARDCDSITEKLKAMHSCLDPYMEYLINKKRKNPLRYKSFSVDGIFDLSMIGSERIEIENKYQELTNGPEVELFNLEGALVYDKDSQKLYQLQERWSDKIIAEDKDRTEKSGRIYDLDNMFYPSARLPEDSFLVVRTAALRDFEKLLSEMDDQPPSNNEEKGTRVDALSVEIDDIIANGVEPKKEPVWRELINRCNPKGNVCLCVEETDKGPIIAYRGAEGKKKTLTKQALAERLRKRKTG